MEQGRLRACNTDGIGLLRDITRLGYAPRDRTLLLVGAVDLVYARREFGRNMRMSRRELTDEFRNREGDPRILVLDVPIGDPAWPYPARPRAGGGPVTADEVLMEFAGGWADIGSMRPMTSDTTMMAFSIDSRVMTSEGFRSSHTISTARLPVA